MNDHRLPDLNPSLPLVARVSANAFRVTLVALALLVTGWGVVLAHLRFTDGVPVSGELVAADADGRWQIRLSSSSGGVDAVRTGDSVRLRLADRPGGELLAEVIGVDAAARRLDAVLFPIEPGSATHLRPGMRVTGRLPVGSLSGLELLARLLRRRVSRS